MTREEAKSCKCTIEMLQRLAYNIHGVMDVIDADNCKKIIKTLEQEPCEDCVSRKALIERINHAEENFKVDNMESIGSDDGDPFVDGVLSGVFNIREMVIQAPSVTLQEPFKPMVEIDLYSVIEQKYIEREVIDKIRAEIESKCCITIGRENDPAITLYDVFEIIDKYKAENELLKNI
jgi:hypothetical protein